MAEAAKFCLKATTKCFKHYLDFDTSLENTRNAFKYFVSQYIRDRIYEPVRHRCGKQYIKRIKECIEELENICPRRTRDMRKGYARLEKSISMEMFGHKTSLMRGFNNQIDTFEEDVSSIV